MNPLCSDRRNREILCDPDARDKIADSIDWSAILRSRKRLMVRRTAERKLRAVLSYRAATLRNSLIRPKKRSTRLRILQISRSSERGDFRLDFDGLTAVAPAVSIRSRIASEIADLVGDHGFVPPGVGNQNRGRSGLANSSGLQVINETLQSFNAKCGGQGLGAVPDLSDQAPS